jgi:hypothetical protein
VLSFARKVQRVVRLSRGPIFDHGEGIEVVGVEGVDGGECAWWDAWACVRWCDGAIWQQICYLDFRLCPKLVWGFLIKKQTGLQYNPDRSAAEPPALQRAVHRPVCAHYTGADTPQGRAVRFSITDRFVTLPHDARSLCTPCAYRSVSSACAGVYIDRSVSLPKKKSQGVP